MPQSLSSILIHLVFSTKLREPFIKPEIESELHAYLSAVFRECKSPSLLIGGTADHIHTLFILHRTFSVAAVVEEVKKSSSKWIKTKGRELQGFTVAGRLRSFFHRAIECAGFEKVHRYAKRASPSQDVSG